jgi:hypothetical protein
MKKNSIITIILIVLGLAVMCLIFYAAGHFDDDKICWDKGGYYTDTGNCDMTRTPKGEIKK